MTALSQDVEADLRRENARLQAELRAARDRQAGSAEILRTIGSASGDAEQSLYQIAETTKRLFEASSVTILVAGGGEWRQIIHDGASSKRIGAEVPVAQLRIGGHSLPGATFSENRQIHLPDIHNVDPAIADWPGLRPARAAGSRTICGTPLRLAGQAVGVLIVHRDRLAPFSAEELGLLQNFADQAAIAIENARLFNQSREALDRQDASADILRTIASSTGDAGRSLQQIAETSARLFGAPSVSLQLADNGEWGQAYRFGDSAQRVRSAVPEAATCRARWSPRTGRFTFLTSIILIPRWRIGRALRTPAPRAPARCAAPRCGAKARRSAFSSSTATGCCRLPLKNSPCSRVSPTRP
jgi:GAF domain-containing protein